MLNLFLTLYLDKIMKIGLKLFVAVVVTFLAFNSHADVISKTAFTKAYVKEAKNHFKGAKFEIKDDLNINVIYADGTSSSTHLGNIYLLYSEHGESIDDVFSDFISSMKSYTLLTDKQQIQLSQLMPVVKPKSYIDKVTAQINQSGDEIPFPFYHEIINDDLILLLALDTPTSIQYLSKSAFSDFNLSKAQLKSIAFENFNKYLEKADASINKMELDGDINLYMFVVDETYEASGVFSSYFQKKIAEKFNGPVGIVMPSRQFVLIAELNDQKSLHQMALIAYNEFPNLPYNISPFAYKYDSGKLEKIKF